MVYGLITGRLPIVADDVSTRVGPRPPAVVVDGAGRRHDLMLTAPASWDDDMEFCGRIVYGAGSN
ncbi:hypothetical protein [Micromonospora sp. NPDC049645]|uniref:hypothetical protein n=1 Tax=Micromonospora sp. NPDC049645 TaxID=3155508 RepID=UPI00342038D1